MVRQLRLICLVSVSVLATGCCCVPGPICGGCPLPLPIPVPTVVPVPLPLPVPALSGAHVANALNSPVFGRMQCRSDPYCAVSGGMSSCGPAPWLPAQPCGESCSEGIYGYGAGAQPQPVYPDQYPSPHTPDAFVPAPESRTPVPQQNLPEDSDDARAHEASGISRTNWESSDIEMNPRVVIPGQRVSNRDMRVQHAVGEQNAMSVLRIPAQ